MVLVLVCYDLLIGVFNCKGLEEVLECEVVCVVCQNIVFFIVFLDIDDFKLINDMYGYSFGDDVLLYLVQVVCELMCL